MEFDEDLLNSMQSVIQEMEWAELASTLEETINELLGNTPNPPPPPPVPAGLEELNTIPQPAESQEGGYGGCFSQGAAPQIMAAPITHEPLGQEDIVQPGHMYRQTGACCQGQYLPYQWPVPDAQTAAAVGYPAAPQHPYNNTPMMKLSDDFTQNLHPVGVLNNGELLYEVPANAFPPPICAAPPPNTFSSKKRNCASQQEDNRPYVKKPPNAFMLFLKEQRPKFAADLNSKGSASVNTVLGQKWKSMTKEEQAKYYEEANKERQLHSQTHPAWSSKDNYGKKRKRKRQRSKAPTRTEASPSAPAEETQQAKELCLTAVQTAGMEHSTSQTAVMEAPHTQTGVMEPHYRQSAHVQLPHTQAMVTVPACDIAHLQQQVYEVSPDPWMEASTSVSTSLACPAAAQSHRQSPSTLWTLEDMCLDFSHFY